ncbi:WD40 repeat domain-containing protein [Rhodopirellula europaea]|uniref:WD40 repeat domain-containing protein n=1 Tax=Rhodopirellula europaea TaxID=1263866 RepID=UPI003D26B924
MSYAMQNRTSISIAATTAMVVLAVCNPNGAFAQVERPQRQSVESNDFYPAAKIELKCTPLSIQFLSEPFSLAIGGSNGQIYFCRIPDLSITSISQAHELAVRSLAFLPRQRVLMSTSYDKVAILRHEDERWHASRTKAVEPVAGVFARPGDHFGISMVGYSSRLYVSSKNELKAVDTESHFLRTGCYSECGKHLCYGDRRGKILLTLVENADDWSTYRTHRVHRRTIRRVDSIPGTSNFVSVGEDGRVAVVDPDRDTAEAVVDNLPTKLVSCTGISSSMVAAGGTNNRIYVVDLTGRRVVQVLDDHRGTVIGLDSSGGMIASIGYDSKVILWRRQTGSPRPNLGLASSAPEVGE